MGRGSWGGCAGSSSSVGCGAAAGSGGWSDVSQGGVSSGLDSCNSGQGACTRGSLDD